MQSLDARVRLAVCLTLSFATAFVTRPAAAAAALLLAAVLLAAAGVPKPAALRKLAAVNTLLAVFWILTPFTTPGEAAWTAGPLAATREGLALTVAVTLKSNAILVFFIALVSGMSLSTFARALSGLRCPDRLITLLLLTERQAVHLNEERIRVNEAAKLRHFSPGLNMRTYRTLASMVGLIFLHAWRHSRFLSDALKLRLFEGRWPRHAFPALTLRDSSAAAAGAALAVAILLADRLLP